MNNMEEKLRRISEALVKSFRNCPEVTIDNINGNMQVFIDDKMFVRGKIAAYAILELKDNKLGTSFDLPMTDEEKQEMSLIEIEKRLWNLVWYYLIKGV